jgi:hypothetical protein
MRVAGPIYSSPLLLVLLAVLESLGRNCSNDLLSVLVQCIQTPNTVFAQRQWKLSLVSGSICETVLQETRAIDDTLTPA